MTRLRCTKAAFLRCYGYLLPAFITFTRYSITHIITFPGVGLGLARMPVVTHGWHAGLADGDYSAVLANERATTCQCLVTALLTSMTAGGVGLIQLTLLHVRSLG